MKNDNQSELTGKLKKISLLFSIIVVLAGFIVLIGWIGNISILKSISPGWISMKANTAICFILSGLTLVLLNREKTGAKAKIIIFLFSIIILLIGTITLFENIFHFNAGIDEFLFKDNIRVNGTAQPGRLSQVTAVCFILFGFSFIFSSFKKYNRSIFQWFYLVAGIIAFFTLISYLFGAKEITSISEYTAIAFHTSLSFVILMLAVLFSRPEEGIMKLISSHGPGGRVFRHTFFLILVIIIVTGWFLFKGEQRNLYDFDIGVPVYIIVIIIVFAIVLFINAANLSRSEERVKQSEDHLHSIFANSSVGLILLDTNCIILELNNRTKYFNSLSFGRVLKKGDNLLLSVPGYRREELRKNFEKTLQGKRVNFESVYPQTDGSIITFNVCLNPVIDPEGVMAGACMTFENITERKKAEEKILKSEEQYRDLVDNISEIICTHDVDGNILSINKAAEKFTGYKFDLQQPMNIKDLLASGVKNEFDSYMTSIKMNGIGQGLMKIKTLSGEIRIWEYNNSLKVNGANSTVVRGYARDITEQKKAEKEMQKSEEKFRSFFDQSADAIFIFDESGRFLDVNTVSVNLLGYTKSEFKNMSLPDILFQEELAAIPIRFDILAAGKSVIRQRRLRRKDGSATDVEIHSKKMPDGTYLGVVRDISERKKAEEKLKQLSQAVEQSPASIVITDLNGNIQYVNQKFINVTGYTPEELIGKNPRILKSGYTSGAEYENLWKRISSGLEWQGELHNKKKNGEFYWESALISPIFNENGTIINFLGIKEDITDRKQAEEALKESEETFRRLFDESADPVLLLDERGFVDCNQSAVSILGFAFKHEVTNKKPWEISPERQPDGKFSLDKAKAMIAKALESGHNRFEWIHTRSDKTEFPVEVMLTPILLGGKQSFYTVWRDITERKKAEKEKQTAYERYDILARATSDTIWDWDMVNNKMLYNDGINKMFGYQEAEVENVIGWWNERLHPDDFQKITELLDDIFENGLDKFQLTYRFRSADGSYKHIFDRAFVIFDENHKPFRMIGAMQDITHQVEEEMHISKAIIDAHEEERGFIGAELHDNVNQILAGSLLALGMVKVSGNDIEKASGFIEMTRTYIGNAIDEIRKLSHQLVPATYKENSLQDIFEDLLSNINLDNRFAVSLHFDKFNGVDIPDNVQINLYRILQEQVKNILKYSEAVAIEISVAIRGNIVVMRIFDNGKGFNTKAKKKGIGLGNIKKRAEALSGKFILNSSPGKGCEIIVELPLVQ